VTALALAPGPACAMAYPGERPGRAGRGSGFVLASALLHALALAALIWSAGRVLDDAPPERLVRLEWENTASPGAGDPADSAAAPAGPALPPLPPLPPAPPPAAALPPLPPLPPAAAPPAPPPPPLAEAPPPAPAPPAPPPAAPPAPPQQPVPVQDLALAPPPPAPPPPPPAPAEPPSVATALAVPPPPPVAAEPPRPPPRPATPSQPAPAASPPAPAPRPVWSPPNRAGAAEAAAAAAATGQAQAEGLVVPPRPAGGARNPSPEYPRASRLRGEQGRVTLLVQVDAEGRVLDLSVLGSSGHAALDAAAARTVRQWRFEPATRGGRPVLATVTVGITFRLEENR
jgi:protein TonB